MDNDEHKHRHIELHRNLDELITDFISNSKASISKTTLIELIEWSHKQTVEPDHQLTGESQK